MKKALVVATVVRFLGFEKNDIKILKELGYEVHCATDLTGETERTSDIDMVRHQIDFSRSPFNKRTLIAYKQLKKLLQEEHFDLIHCHTPVGGILARLAARKLRKKGKVKVIYTAHGFHFFKGAPIINWLLYYPIEWICSWMTDILITINNEDFERAKKRFHAKIIKHIPGVGLDINRIRSIRCNRNIIRKKLGIPFDAVVLMSVGEINDNKNHEIIIKAISKIKDEKLHYIICGKGPKIQYYQTLIEDLGLSDKVKLLGYRNDVIELYNASDVCVFPSKREGLGLAAIEGMVVGLPLISSNIHGIKDYSIDGKTGFVASPNDIDGFIEAICKLKDNTELREKFGNYNRKVADEFAICKVSSIMNEIYCDICRKNL